MQWFLDVGQVSIRSRQTFDKIGWVCGRVYAVCRLHNCIKRDTGVGGSGGGRLCADRTVSGAMDRLRACGFCTRCAHSAQKLPMLVSK